jgi:hypothetical protein
MDDAFAREVESARQARGGSMKIRAFVLPVACAASVASLAGVAAAADHVTKAHVAKIHMRKAAPPPVLTVHPDPRGGWGGPEWYTKGWGDKGWGYGPGQGLLAGALVGGGSTAPYVDFTFGYPARRLPYVAFPYGVGYPYYTISYGYYRPPH